MTVCKTDRRREAAERRKALSSVIGDDLEGWDEGGGRLRREGVHAYVELIPTGVQQKHSTAKQLCSDLKINTFFNKATFIYILQTFYMFICLLERLSRRGHASDYLHVLQ